MVTFKQAGKTFSPADVNSFEIESPLAPGDGEYLVFKNGTLIKGKSRKFDSKKNTIFFEIKGFEKEVSVDLLKGISFNGCRYIDSSVQKLGFTLKTGQFFEGSPAYFTRTMIGRSKPSKMRFKKEALDSLLLNSTSKPESAEIVVHTSSREIYCGSLINAGKDSVKIKYPLGELEIKNSHVVRFETVAKTTPLIKAHIAGSTTKAFLGTARNATFNTSFTEGFKSLNGFPIPNYIAMQSHTELKVNVPSGHKIFKSHALLDPNASNGDLVLKVIQKGKTLYEQRIKDGDKPHKINVKVCDGQLEIIATFGKKGSVGDYLLLANPKFSEK